MREQLQVTCLAQTHKLNLSDGAFLESWNISQQSKNELSSSLYCHVMYQCLMSESMVSPWYKMDRNVIREHTLPIPTLLSPIAHPDKNKLCSLRSKAEAQDHYSVKNCI